MGGLCVSGLSSGRGGQVADEVCVTRRVIWRGGERQARQVC